MKSMSHIHLNTHSLRVIHTIFRAPASWSWHVTETLAWNFPFPTQRFEHFGTFLTWLGMFSFYHVLQILVTSTASKPLMSVSTRLNDFLLRDISDVLSRQDQINIDYGGLPPPSSRGNEIRWDTLQWSVVFNTGYTYGSIIRQPCK